MSTSIETLLRDIRDFLERNSFGETGTRSDEGLLARIDKMLAEPPTTRIPAGEPKP